MTWPGTGPVRLIALALALAAGSGPLGAAPVAPETAIKGTYLYKFIPFVEWPDAAFAGPDSPIRLCLFGGDPFGDDLDRAIARDRPSSRDVQVVRLRDPAEVPSCHLLFVPDPDDPAGQAALRTAAGKPVLTIVDGPSTGEAPGLIRFVIRENRVRFHIDDMSAASAGLTLRAPLLNLALSLTSRRETAR